MVVELFHPGRHGDRQALDGIDGDGGEEGWQARGPRAGDAVTRRDGSLVEIPRSRGVCVDEDAFEPPVEATRAVVFLGC